MRSSKDKRSSLPEAVVSLAPAAVYRTPPPLPRPRPLPVTARDAAAANWVLELSTGLRTAVVGPGVIGRQPTSNDPTVSLIELPDPRLLLSRNHLAFGLTETGVLWVEDLGSRNGTHLMNGRLQSTLPAHQRIPLTSGAIIRFGNHTAAFTTRWS